MNEGVIPYKYFLDIQKDPLLGENPYEVTEADFMSYLKKFEFISLRNIKRELLNCYKKLKQSQESIHF